MIEVDHVLWGAADLDEGVATLDAATGLAAVPGGSHPGWGTRNAVVGLGDTYLEVLATDPAQDGGWLAEQVLALPGPCLFRWALRTDDMDGLVERVRSAGMRTEPVAMSRTTPDGETVRWRIAFLDGHGLGHVAPFAIDWLDTTHPSVSLDDQGVLTAVEVGHPAPDDYAELLAVLGVETVTVEEAGVPWVRATLDVPRGRVELGGPS